MLMVSKKQKETKIVHYKIPTKQQKKATME